MASSNQMLKARKTKLLMILMRELLVKINDTATNSKRFTIT